MNDVEFGGRRKLGPAADRSSGLFLLLLRDVVINVCFNLISFVSGAKFVFLQH